jgi:hypothetical protein
LEQQQDTKKQNRFLILLFVVIIPLVVVAGFFAYIKLGSATKTVSDTTINQEQFAGEAVTSSQLQGDCQKSAEKIAKASDLNIAVSEYRQNAANCRDVYFAIEGNSKFKNEGMYPDLAIDIAVQLFKTDKTKALEMLSFAKTLPTWEFNMGPVTCDSAAVVDAYVESFNMSSDKVCIKLADYKTQLLPALKNKSFSDLSKMVANDRVVWLGLPESDVGCPEKFSSVLKIIQNSTAGGVSLEENRPENTESNSLSFLYKSKTEDKITLQFSVSNECLQLSSVLVAGQANE